MIYHGWRRERSFRSDAVLCVVSEVFQCDLCPQWFRARKSLNHHLEVHLGRTRCPVCHMVLSRKFALKRHMARAHPDRAGEFE